MITKEWTLPDVIAKYPAARGVFDRYGLHGCGGPLGPRETVEFFARVHAVPLDLLLSELNLAHGRPAEDAPYAEELGDILYRRFFRGAIVVILTAGATLGAAILFLYGLRGSFLSLDLFAPLQAHANAQVFGWVGLFVMGFACQGFPRFKYVRLWRPELANLSFQLMLAGLILRTLAGVAPLGALPLGVAGGLLEAAAVATFVVVIGRTLAASTTRDAWDKYVYVGLAAFLAAALLEPAVYAATFSAASEDALVSRVATYMGPYRDLQLLGFAGFMILGVSQRILPAAFGFRSVGSVQSAGAFALLAVGLLVDIVAWLVHRSTRDASWAMASWAGVSLYACGALWLAVSLGGAWSGDAGRSTKFVRAAYVWLAIACLMMIAEPLYLRATGVRFSHAYHGAIRHAFTVGFISLMILGVSSKVVPILRGVDPAGLPALWAPFVLINAGNALRVGSQVATDLAPAAAFPVMGVSGSFEVLGLAIWGVHLWRLMGQAPAAAAPAAKPERIAAGMTAANIIDWYPETLEVFEEFGFKELRNPILRNTLARRVTVRMACGMKRVDEETFVEALNARIRRAEPAHSKEATS